MRLPNSVSSPTTDPLFTFCRSAPLCTQYPFGRASHTLPAPPGRPLRCPS